MVIECFPHSAQCFSIWMGKKQQAVGKSMGKNGFQKKSDGEEEVKSGEESEELFTTIIIYSSDR